MRVRLWMVLSSLGTASCGDSVVIARELVVQGLSSEVVADAGADAGNHAPDVSRGSSEGGSATSTTRASSKSTDRSVDAQHHSSSSPTEGSDGGSHADPTTGHH